MATQILIDKLRELLGDIDQDSEVWDDAQLSAMIDEGVSEYTYGQRTHADGSDDDITQGMKLARSIAMYELASNTALFFKWRDQQKEIDKSMTPEMARRIGKDLHAQVMQHRKAKDNNEGEQERATAQGGIAQFDAGTTAAERTEARRWF